MWVMVEREVLSEAGFGDFGGEGEVEGGALVGVGFEPDVATVAADDFFANGEADAGAGVFVGGVEALKDDEDTVGKSRVNADAIVGNGEVPVGVVLCGGDGDVGGKVGFAEFEGIADEVLEELGELGVVAVEGGKGAVDGDDGASFANGDFEVLEGAVDDFVAVNGGEGFGAGVEAGIFEEVEDELLHAFGAFDGEADVAVGVFVESALVAVLEELDVAGDHAEGFLEVVGGDVGELLEFGVGAGEGFGSVFEIFVGVFEFFGAFGDDFFEMISVLAEFFLGAAAFGDFAEDSFVGLANGVVAGLDGAEHLVEGAGESGDFVGAVLFSADRVVTAFGNVSGGFSESEDGF